MLVWNAIPSITPMMSAIFLLLSWMPAMVSTTRPTTSPPLTAMSEALTASVLACRALSAFCFTMPVSCSMLDAVSSSDEACCSVRCDRSALPAAICCVALAIASDPVRTWPTMPCRLSCIRCRASSMRPVSSARSTWIACVRSPRVMCSACSMARFSGTVIERRSDQVSSPPPTMPTSSSAAVRALRPSCSRWPAS